MRMWKSPDRTRFTVICDNKKRRIWILGAITAFSEEKIAEFLNVLSKSLDPIEFIISSHGGDFFPALGIYQRIKNLRCKTKTIGFGQVNSGAFLIFQSGDERVASQGAYFYFHPAIDEGKLKKAEEPNANYYYEMAKTLDRADAIQYMIFTLRGRPVSKIFNLFHWGAGFTAQAAKKLKLVDKIISPQKVPRPPKIKSQKGS